MKPKFTCIILFLIANNLYAQNNRQDSLKALLLNGIQDSTRINVLNELILLTKDSDPEKAYGYAIESKAVAAGIHDERAVRNSLHTLGVICTSLGHYEDALKYLRQAVLFGAKLNLKKEVAASCQNLGNVYLNMGNYSAALPYYLNSLKIKQELGNKKGMAGTYNSLGNLYLAQMNYDLALKNYTLSAGLFKEVKDSSGLAVAYDGLAALFIEEEKLEEALTYTQASLEIKKQKQNIPGQLFCYNNLGKIYATQGNNQAALKNYQKSLSIATQTGNVYDLATAYLSVGSIYKKVGDYSRAEAFLEKGLDLAKETGSGERLFSGYKYLADLYEAKQDFKKALFYSVQFYASKDSIFNEEKNKAITEIQTRFETEKKEKEIKLLQQQKENLIQNNKIKELQLSRSRYLLLTLTGIVVLVIIIGLLAAGQIKLRAGKARLEAEQKLLRSQMNPHFIFNSLNSIQDFIANYERDDALKYLSKFSKLIRAILKQSGTTTTTLAEELDMLKLYVELEALRFNHKFDCIFDIDPAINPDEIIIPSMIIQPFIENAILHGFIGREKDCHIRISFRMDKSLLTCNILDNGIGRKKGNEIKLNKSYQHPGLGIQLTTDRIETINKSSKGKAALQIEDLYDTNGEANGTKVELVFAIA